MATVLCPIGSETVTNLPSYGRIRQSNDESANAATEPDEPYEPYEPNEPTNVSIYEPDANESADEPDANEPSDADAIQLLYATVYDATTTDDANDATTPGAYGRPKTPLFLLWLAVSKGSTFKADAAASIYVQKTQFHSFYEARYR